MKDFSDIGKSSTGWFYGMKLHLVINGSGEILSFCLTCSNMKNKLVTLEDKFLLRKRAIIESVNNILKENLQIEHTRYRSSINFLINLVSGIVAYSFLDSKPTIFT